MTAVNEQTFLREVRGFTRAAAALWKVSAPGCSDPDPVRFDRKSHQGPLKDELNNKLQLLASWTSTSS